MLKKKTRCIIVSVLVVAMILFGASSLLAETVGLSLYSMLSRFFVCNQAAVESASQYYGYRVVSTGEAPTVKDQIDQFATLAARKVDGVVFMAMDENAIEEGLNMLARAGIPAVSIDRTVQGPTLTTIQTDNQEMARACCRKLAEIANGRKMQILLLEGEPGSGCGRDRTEGFLGEIKKYPNLEIVSRKVTMWYAEKALSLTKEALQANPNIDAIFAENNGMLAGVIPALQEMGRLYPVGHPRHISIVSIDGDPYGLMCLRKKYIDLVCNQHPWEMAALAVHSLNMAFEGRADDVPPQLYIGFDLLTPFNVNQYKGLWGDMKFK